MEEARVFLVSKAIIVRNMRHNRTNNKVWGTDESNLSKHVVDNLSYPAFHPINICLNYSIYYSSSICFGEDTDNHLLFIMVYQLLDWQTFYVETSLRRFVSTFLFSVKANNKII